MKAIFGLAVAGAVVLCALTADTYFLRDPLVDLGNGYVLFAPSPGSPCEVGYMASRDGRQYSAWRAHENMRVPEGSNDRFSLWNADTGEFFTTPSRDDWLRVRRQYGARPVYAGCIVGNVRAYRKLGGYVIGPLGGGGFILDVESDILELCPSADEWDARLRQRHLTRDVRFRNPRSPWAQTARAALYGGALVMAAVAGWSAWRGFGKPDGTQDDRSEGAPKKEALPRGRATP